MGKTWNVGDVLTSADMNEWAGGTTGTKFAIKGADTNRSNTTTLANDPDLSVTVDANKTYWLEAVIAYQGPAAGGFKFTWTAPAGIAYTGVYHLAVSAGTTTVVFDAAGNLITGTYNTAADGAGIEDLIMFRGTFVTAGTAGSLTFQWAQNTVNATSTIARKGSAVLLKRVA